MRLLRISRERIAALSLVLVIFLLITIIRENRALESYDAENDNLPAAGANNLGDEDDEKDFNFPFTEGTSTYVTNVSPDTKNREKCNGDQMMIYLAEIQVINPETILQIASYKDIESVCRKVEIALESIDTWTMNCHSLPTSDLYMRLAAGVKVLANRICTKSNYQLEFKKYTSCYQQLHNEYIDCTGPADWIIDMEDHELCNQYKVIADCYYTQTAMLCGVKAAKTLKELIVRVINAVIQTHCPEVKKNPSIPDPMTEHTVFTRRSSSSKIRPTFKMYFSICVIDLLIYYNLYANPIFAP